MLWKNPPVIKIYEALGALADKRLKEGKDSEGKKEWRVYSSSGNKFYTIRYDTDKNAIMTNDNGSYWVGYLGYPAITFLMSIGKIKYQQEFSEALKGIKWKDVNTKFKNDYDKTIKYCQKVIQAHGHNLKEFLQEVKNIEEQIGELKIRKLGKRVKPPKGY